MAQALRGRRPKQHDREAPQAGPRRRRPRPATKSWRANRTRTSNGRLIGHAAHSGGVGMVPHGAGAATRRRNRLRSAAEGTPRPVEPRNRSLFSKSALT
jgi:hypothetical protein